MESLKDKILNFKQKSSQNIKNIIFDTKIKAFYLGSFVNDLVPRVNKERISKLELIAKFTMPPLSIVGAALPCYASETINVKDYIKGKFPTMFNIYLDPLGDLDEKEKAFIDILEMFPEDKQSLYAKKILKEGFSQETVENMKKDEDYMKKDEFSYEQKSFIDSLNSTILHTKKFDLDIKNEDVKLALDVIGKHPKTFDPYDEYWGKFRSDALMNIIKIGHEIESEINMSVDEFVHKYYKLISVLEERMNIFYDCRSNGLTGKPMTGPFKDIKLDEKEYTLVKEHLVDIIKKNEENIFGLNLSEPNKMNSLKNGLNEIQLHENDLMESMALSKLILPYELFVLKNETGNKIGFIDGKAGNSYLIDNSSFLLENAIRNQKLSNDYFNELKSILIDSNLLNEYAKKATTWTTEDKRGFRNNGIYLPVGKNLEESIAYQVSKFLNENDQWSKLNLAALNMIMERVNKITERSSSEDTTIATYFMGLLGLPAYNIQISEFKNKYSNNGLTHDDIAIMIPSKTFKVAQDKFGEVVNNKGLVVSPFYFNKEQVEKYFKPKSIDVLSGNNFKTNFLTSSFDSIWRR
jgi:hypothetical protein